MTTNRDSYVFISHSSANRALAEALYQALSSEQHGLDCWLDNKDLHPEGGSFPEQIVEGIRRASAFVLLDTPEARRSDYVRREVQLAQAQHLPIYRLQPGKTAAQQQRRIQQLAHRIHLRMSRPFWVTVLLLALTLAVLAGAAFWLGVQVVPVLAGSLATPTPTPQPTLPPDPQLAAPFHFQPKVLLLEDDFNDPAWQGSFNSAFYTYDLRPADSGVQIGQEEGTLRIFLPRHCQSNDRRYDCEVQINSMPLRFAQVQYLGLRLRVAQPSAAQHLSISISSSTPDRRRTGFGWNFSNDAVPFYRRNINLPEGEFYAFVALDEGWHAYEIVRDPQTGSYSYYMDGQRIGSHTTTQQAAWQDAPLQLILYALSEPGNTSAQRNDFEVQLDLLRVGSFATP